MKKIYIFLFIIFLAYSINASFSYYKKKDLIRFSDAIAIVKITKVENAKMKGKRDFYLEKSTAEVKEVLKGNLPKEVFLYGEETFVCGQCNFNPGEALVFLKYDSGFLRGLNFENCYRPIKNGLVEWYEKDDDYYHYLNYVPLNECIEDIKSILENREPSFPLTFKNKKDYGNCNISGRVIDVKTNKGVEGVTAIVTCLKGGNTYKLRKCKSITDKDGNYFIKNVPTGNYKLELWNKYDLVFEYAQGESHKKLDLKGKDLVDVNFRIKMLGSIEGNVYDTDGKTLLNDYYIIPYKNKQPYITGDSPYRVFNPNGFNYKHLEDYDSWRLAVSFRGHFYLDDQYIKLKNAEKISGINIIVKESNRKPSLFGILKDKKGNVTNKYIDSVELWSSNNAIHLKSTTDNNGNYAFYGIPSGKYAIIHTGFDTTIKQFTIRVYDSLMIYETSNINKNMIYDFSLGVTGSQFRRIYRKEK